MFTGVDRNHGNPPVRLLEQMMTTPNPGNLESSLAQ